MKFGLFAINYGTCADPEVAVRVAQHAEAAGFESVWTGEHVVLPDPQLDSLPFPPTLPLLDTVVALTAVACHTTTIRVASGIIVLPLRNPVLLAKELASVDVVAKGRLIVGVGGGYIPCEFDAVGVPMAERGERMDDYLGALRAMWSMDKPEHHGPFASFSGIDAHPRPVQRPGPPIVVGGDSRAVLRRAVTMAEGWYGFNVDLELARRFVEALGEVANVHQRPADLGRLEITSRLSERSIAQSSNNTSNSVSIGWCCSPSPTPTATIDTCRCRSIGSCTTSTWSPIRSSAPDPGSR